jgi:hypothetical protein
MEEDKGISHRINEYQAGCEHNFVEQRENVSLRIRKQKNEMIMSKKRNMNKFRPQSNSLSLCAGEDFKVSENFFINTNTYLVNDDELIFDEREHEENLKKIYESFFSNDLNKIMYALTCIRFICDIESNDLPVRDFITNGTVSKLIHILKETENLKIKVLFNINL